jgi:hypothetical protein
MMKKMAPRLAMERQEEQERQQKQQQIKLTKTD